MKAILILSFLILLSSTVDGQQWPRAEQNEQHHINGTVGESRDEAGDDRRWHKGCDVRLRPAGMPVLAIEDGVFNRVNYFEVCVGSYCHTHVIPDPRFMDGDPIVAGETIGHTQNIGEPHIHLQQSNADTENVTGNAYKNDAIEWINALHNLIPFTDVVDPVINNMTLWRHGMNNIGITGPLLEGELDILLHSDDSRVSVTGEEPIPPDQRGACAPYHMSWAILNNQGGIEAEFEGITFDIVPPNTSAGTVLANQSEDFDFHYYITNDPFNYQYDKYWHTRQRLNGEYNELTSCPMNVKLKDGNNLILRGISEDIAGNRAERDITGLQIDNFQPFIYEVIAKIGTETAYSANWDCAQGCDGVSFFENSIIAGINNKDMLANLSITVKASEEMTSLSLSILNTPVQNRALIIIDEDQNEWGITISIDELMGIKDVQLSFDGVDLNSNSLLNMNSAPHTCAEIPYRIGPNAGDWQNPNNITTSPDDLHSFIIECLPYSGTPDPIVLLDGDECLEDNSIEYEVIPTSGPLMNDGAIIISHIDAIPPLTIYWDDDPTNTSLIRQSLPAGTYCINIEDAYCCVDDRCFTIITDCSNLNVNVQNISYPYSCKLNGGCTGFIEIIGSGSGSYQFQWSGLNTGFSSSNQNIYNLCADTYRLVITDVITGCQKVFSYSLCCCTELIEPGEPSKACVTSGTIPPNITVDGNVIFATSININDGSIDLNVSGGINPKYFVWSGPNGYVNYNEDISDLYPGEYCVTIRDGCNEVEKCFIVESCEDQTFTIDAEIIPPCDELTNNGSIILNYSGSYSFLWDNATTSSTRSNLSIGTYFVTVTDNETLCEKSFEYVVTYGTAKTIVLDHKKNSCSDINDGELTFSVSPIYSITSIFWTDEPSNTSLSRTNLTPGITYCINVTDHCGTISHCEFIEESYIDISSTYAEGCGMNDGWIELDVTGLNAPFTYSWSNGESTSRIENLNYGTYTVTVVDNIGCESIETFNLEHPIEIIEQGDACNPYNDGFITLRINNPNEVRVSVDYSWSPCPDCPTHPIIEDNYSNPIEFTLVDLFEDDYTLYIEYGECFFEYTFSIGREPDNLVYNDYEKRDGIIYCIYDVECRDNLDEEGYEKKAKAETYGIECPFTFGHPFRGCGGVEYKCDDHVIEERNVRMVWMRRAEAVELALKLASSGVIIASPEAIEFILGGDPCDRVLVCPNNPLCIGLINRTSDVVNQVTIGDCTYFTCRFIWRSQFKICGLDYVPSYLRDYVEPNEPGGGEQNCENKVSRPLYWLVENYGLMAADMGTDFTNSTLADFIALHTNNPKRWCAIVVYCCNTNEYIDSNVEDIGICGTFNPAVTCGSFTESATCSPSETYPETKVICPPNSIGLECPYSIQERLTTPYSPAFKCTHDAFNDDVVIESLTISSNFSNFIPVPVDNDLMEPHALYSSDYGFFMESMTNIDDLESLGTDLVKYQYDATQRIEVGIINEDGASWLRVNHRFEHFDAILPLDTNISSVYHLSKVDSTYFVVFGDKQFEFQHTYTESPQNSNYSILTYDHQLALIDQKIIEGQSIFSNAHSNKNVILIKKSLGGSSFQLEAFDLILGTIQSSINITGDFKILDFDALSSTNFAIVVSPTTAISINDTLNAPANSNVSLIHVQGSNVRQQHLTLNSTQNHCVTMTPNQTLVLGLNVSDNDEVLLQGHNIPIQNPNDILTIYFDSVLNITGYKVYGTPSREEIFDMYFSGNYIFIGGEFSGTTSIRNIGRLNFWLLEQSINRPFISYDTLIPTSLLGDSISQDALLTQTSFSKSETGLLFIAPNPTSQTLVIQSYHTSQINSVIVYSIDGKPVFLDNSNNDFKNNRTLNVSGLNNGIYLVEIIHDDGLRCTKKIIKN